MRLAKGTRDDTDQAIALFEEATRSEPGFAPAYMALYPVYRKRGWLGKELRLWRRRFEVAPEDPEASERIGWILWFTGHADQALPMLEKTVAQRPAGEWGHFYLGNAYLALRNYPEAERRYRTLLESHPDHSSAHAGVIWTLLAAGKDEAARSRLRQFQAKSFDGDRYFLKVADIEHFLGEQESALLHVRQALVEDPGQRFWPRGFCPSTIEGAILWSTDHTAAEEALRRSEHIDRDRLEGGDEGYMPHIDLAAVHAIRGGIRQGCASLRAAGHAGWRAQPLAIRDPLLRGLRGDDEFESLIAN